MDGYDRKLFRWTAMGVSNSRGCVQHRREAHHGFFTIEKVSKVNAPSHASCTANPTVSWA